MTSRIWTHLAWILTSVCWPATSVGDDWRLVFKDDFERAELGDSYMGAKPSIKDGSMNWLAKEGKEVLIKRPFTTDVRIEFDTWAGPEMPPCDLSVIMNTVYLLGFGARGNTANHIVGAGLSVVDLDPPFLIEQGKKYHIVAHREGKRITCTVNDTLILEATNDELRGGKGFDQVGWITWGDMYVDNVRVYERSEPHPDTPKYITSLPGLPFERDGRMVKAVQPVSPAAQKALDTLNAGRYNEAKTSFNALDNVTERLAGLAHLYGDVNYHERPATGDTGSHRDFGELGDFAEQWRKQAAAHPDNATLQAYLPAVKEFGKLILSRSGRHAAIILIGLGPENNPFYRKAQLFKARYTYWDGMEGGNAEVKNLALDIMRELITIWPDNRVLNEYVGTPVPWGEELNADTTKDPAWAAYLREAYAREIAVMERFVDTRQTPDGAFGGGWGDDVEMMRTWVPIATISDCSTKIIKGITDLTEGIHKHVAPLGYPEGIGDVEHTAEPTADTYPTMLLLRHGDPRYVELNLASCKIIKDVTMGIDANGYPRFKSVEMGANGVNEQLFGGGDTGYHARAMKHFFYLAWYGNSEAKDWYTRWAEGWRHAVLIDEPYKVAGLAPGTIWYPSGSYYPPNGEPWYSDKALNYYGVTGMGIMVHQSFLAGYSLTYDAQFLQPFQRMMDHSTYGPYGRGQYEPGSIEWQRGAMAHHSSSGLTSHYRMLTGERVYDEYTRRFGTGPQLYQIDQDLERFKASFERAARSLRHNLWFYTTEVLSTDRLHLPAVPEVWGAYTGAISTTVDAETPTMGVTWETPDANFAALVTENAPTRLRAHVYTFWDRPTQINMKLWQLVPGKYIVLQGAEHPGEQAFQKRYGWGEPDTASFLRKGELYTITVPPRTLWIVDIRLHEDIDVPDLAPDLAIHERDVKRVNHKIAVTIHNIGNTAAEDFIVELQQGDGDDWTPIAQAPVKRLSQPVEFSPYTTTRVFDLPSPSKAYRIVLDPDDDLFELCELNNVAMCPNESTPGAQIVPAGEARGAPPGQP